jgi:hypothetical protein
MLKKSIVALLLGCCSLAQAGIYQLTATYTGFADYNTGVFDAGRTATLHAVIDDVNGDRKFTVDEVRDFSFPYASIEGWRIETYGRCAYADQENWCLQAFSYTGGNALTFESSMHRTDFEASSGSRATSGEAAFNYFQYTTGEEGGGVSYDGIRWTAETTLAVTVTPAVPEPSTYAMLGVGLFAVGAVARRRRKQ